MGNLLHNNYGLLQKYRVNHEEVKIWWEVRISVTASKRFPMNLCIM